MNPYEQIYDVDLSKGITQKDLGTLVFEGDNNSIKVGSNVYNSGAPQQLSGSIEGKVIRQDGGTVYYVGTISDNTGYITLTEAAFAYPGPIEIFVRIVSGQDRITIGAFKAKAKRTDTGKAIDPGQPVPGIAELAEDVAELKTGKKNTQTAISSPAASGNALAFIDTISQNEQGVITATKKSVQLNKFLGNGTLYTYPSKWSGSANDIKYEYHGFVYNVSNVPSEIYGFLDVSVANAGEFSPSGGKPVIRQIFTPYSNPIKMYARQKIGDSDWSDWKNINDTVRYRDFMGRDTYFTYSSLNGGNADDRTREAHYFVFNMSNTPGHGFLDVSYADGSGFNVTNGKPIIRQVWTSYYNPRDIMVRLKKGDSAWTSWARCGYAITANLGTITGTGSTVTVTKSVTGVTAAMTVDRIEFGTPSAVQSGWTVTTAADSVTFSATISGSTTVKIKLSDNTDITGA